MLDRTGNTAGDVEARTDGDTGLSYLIIVIDPSGVDCGAGSGDFTADGFSQIADKFEVFFGTDTVTTGDDDLGPLKIDLLFGTDTFNDLNDGISSIQFDRNFDQFTLAIKISFAEFHHALADGDHLGIVPGVDDGSDDVTAESRTDLHKFVGIALFVLEIFKVVDLQVGAVGSKTGKFFGSDAGSKFTSLERGTEKKNIRTVFQNKLHNNFGIRHDGKGFKAGIFRQQYPVAAVVIKRVNAAGEVVSEQHTFELDAEAVGELTSFGDQLQADSGDLPLLLLDEDPNISNISHSSHPKV